MTMAKITHELVFQAADQLVSEGKSVSAEAIRLLLGGVGSKETIQKYLEEWKIFRARNIKINESAEMLPDNLLKLAANHVQDLSAIFKKMEFDEIEQLVKNAESKIEEAQAEKRDTLALLADWEQKYNAEVAEKNAAHKEVEQLRIQVTKVEANEQAKNSYLVSRNFELQTELAAALKKIENLYLILQEKSSQLAAMQVRATYAEADLNELQLCLCPGIEKFSKMK